MWGIELKQFGKRSKNMDLVNKHRPTEFTEAIRGDVMANLLNPPKDGKVPQCFLLFGESGTGKTTLARIAAKQLTGDTNIYEIDASANPNVEDVRSINELVSVYSPLPKVFIIDEANHYAKKSWDTFLKTIEEPPEDVYFFFLTTSPEKIPDTVLSRLMPVHFMPHTLDDIYHNLSSIASKERIKVDNITLTAMARRADGNMRTAIKSLEQFAITGDFNVVDIDEFTEKVLTLEYTQKYLEKIPDLTYNTMQMISCLLEKGTEHSVMLANMLLQLYYESCLVLQPKEYLINGMLLLKYNSAIMASIETDDTLTKGEKK